MTKRGFHVVLCWVLLAVAVSAAQSLQVTPLVRDGRLLVSFKFGDAFGDEVRAAIHSGMTISFVYDIELKRSATLWLDRTMASATVTASVRYDNLTRRYNITRLQDGRIDRADSTDAEDVARVWLTEFDKLSLFRSTALEANGEYYLRVHVHSTPRNAAFVWPWDRGIAGLAKFTFIQ